MAVIIVLAHVHGSAVSEGIQKVEIEHWPIMTLLSNFTDSRHIVAKTIYIRKSSVVIGQMLFERCCKI